MKKLSKTAWIVLGVGIFIIAFASLYMLYYQQGIQQRQLEDSLSDAQVTGTRVNAEKADWQSQFTQLEGELTQLEDELAQAIIQLDSTREILPRSVESIEYDERLFEFAHSWGLTVVKLTASEPDDIEVEDITFYVTQIVVAVRGEVDDILTFIGTIVADPDFTNATVEVVDMVVPEPVTSAEIQEMREDGATEEEIAEEIRNRTPVATIGLKIYSYQGE